MGGASVWLEFTPPSDRHDAGSGGEEACGARVVWVGPEAGVVLSDGCAGALF